MAASKQQEQQQTPSDQSHNFRLQFITWNVCDTAPLNVAPLFTAEGPPPDLIAIGLQEAPGNPATAVIFEDTWGNASMKHLSQRGYVKIRTERMQAILLHVFVKLEHLSRIRWIKTAFTRTGVGGYWNPGKSTGNFRVRTRKAAGPDGIPGKLIKLFAYELSSPLADILNSSLQHGLVLEEWKCATVVPIPKSKPPSVNELRPISLTSLLGKIAESFVTQWTLSDILPQIDTQQFGCLKGRSTTHCLLDLTNEIFKATDKPGTLCSLVATDYSKAFDRVCYNVAICRLIDLGLRPSLTRWITNFLTNRRQLVRYHGVLSDNVTVTCGLPQGTLLGPLIFIAYINGAARNAVSKQWKFVDDLNLLEVRHPISAPSTIQHDLTDLENWSYDSHMKLHPGKCKVLHIYFSKVPYPTPSLKINNIELQQVKVMKILGVFLQHDLRWNSHVDAICSKSSQRLFLLRKLKHFHIPTEDLVTVYVTYVRPVLEYAATIWHSGLTTTLSNRIEKVQRRAVRIIMGADYRSYTDACVHLGLPSLQTRRLQLGNKGAVTVRMDLYGTSVCITNTHLAAHLEQNHIRIQEFHAIMEAQRFPGCKAGIIMEHDFIFWIGDLNFRLDPIEYEAVMTNIADERFQKLLEFDQLKEAQREGLAFSGFSEGTITFQPTYKFDKGTTVYDTSEKQRKPGWCDRILWRTRPGAELSVRQHSYTSLPHIKQSDHSPVTSTFSLQVQYCCKYLGGTVRLQKLE
ncbi:INPP5B [Branchiostoma lanceolatum]|uniref:phosphoinositide 5-phosphatase n=1 Tax=Branchiostoma lanceolatum TaxID=7740 RepID=A0A8J9V9Y8_BRALA|nr:INPP5B [Branchiostoma lanceolatum]